MLTISSDFLEVIGLLFDICQDQPTNIFVSVMDLDQSHWSFLLMSILNKKTLHYNSLSYPHGNQTIAK